MGVNELIIMMQARYCGI
jgi:hypothetical protein